jgi:hypothetical protein
VSDPSSAPSTPPDPASPSAGGTAPAAATSGTDAERRGSFGRLGADWTAVVVAGVLVVLAGLGLLPTVPFLIK